MSGRALSERTSQRGLTAPDATSPDVRSLSDPKPAKRIRNAIAFDEFHAAGHLCLVCGRRNPNAAHLLGKGGGRGDDVPPNLIPLCGSGSSGCHGAYDNGHSYIGDFGRKVTPEIVRASILGWLRSEAGEDARLYLTAKLGAEGSRAWIVRTFGESWF